MCRTHSCKLLHLCSWPWLFLKMMIYILSDWMAQSQKKKTDAAWDVISLVYNATNLHLKRLILQLWWCCTNTQQTVMSLWCIIFWMGMQGMQWFLASLQASRNTVKYEYSPYIQYFFSHVVFLTLSHYLSPRQTVIACVQRLFMHSL